MLIPVLCHLVDIFLNAVGMLFHIFYLHVKNKKHCNKYKYRIIIMLLITKKTIEYRFKYAILHTKQKKVIRSKRKIYKNY